MTASDARSMRETWIWDMPELPADVRLAAPPDEVAEHDLTLPGAELADERRHQQPVLGRGERVGSGDHAVLERTATAVARRPPSLLRARHAHRPRAVAYVVPSSPRTNGAA